MTEIRSHRSVFDLERRIYRIDRLRLNPGGIPVRGVVYCLAILAGLALAGATPLLGAPIRALPWYLRDLVVPAASAGVLTLIRVEGRPFHLAAAALLRHGLGPRRLAGGLRPCRTARDPAPGRRWRPGELLVLPDGSDARLRRLRYTGPGAVLVSVEHERSESRMARSWLTLREPPVHRGRSGRGSAGRQAAGKVIALGRGTRLRVR